MKIIEIFDSEYSKDKLYNYTRYAVRAVIINKDKLYLEYASTPKMVMLPGGGVEYGESNGECIIRECKEECGVIVNPIKELFAIREYYRNTVFFSTYTLCEIVGRCEISHTENEKTLNLVSEWQERNVAIRQIESLMSEYEDGDEELYGCHKREYLALKEIANIYNDIK